jgi:hypothetical protein
MEKRSRRLKGWPVAEALRQAQREENEGAEAWNRALVLVALRCCPTCRVEAKRIPEWQLAGGVGEPPPRPGEAQAVSVAELERARAAIAPLACLNRKPRISAIRRSRAKLRGRAILEALLGATRAALPGDPEESARWAECALWAARFSDSTFSSRTPTPRVDGATCWGA